MEERRCTIPDNRGQSPINPCGVKTMEWMDLAVFMAYGVLGIVSLLVWWVIYDYVLTPGQSVQEAIFGRQPNLAVATDLLGGLLALGILIYSVLTSPEIGDFVTDLEATALTLLGMVVLLGVLRLGIGGFLRLWFRELRDAQGDIITINNELFRQRNLATGLFSTSMYLVLAGGIVEEDLLNLAGYRGEALFNMLGVWVMGMVVVLLHSWLYLGIGSANHILHECFHDNNPAAAFSMLGLVSGMLMLNHQFLAGFESGQHMFNQPMLWAYLAGALGAVVLLRLLLQGGLALLLGVNLRVELVVRDNPAWGVLDGGLILVFFLIMVAVLT